jgi:hypothetical protein
VVIFGVYFSVTVVVGVVLVVVMIAFVVFSSPRTLLEEAAVGMTDANES